MARRTCIRLQLRKSSCVRVEIFAVSIPRIHQKKQHSIIITRSWVLVYITFVHGWTDGRTDIFWKSFIFSSLSRIYIHVYTYLDYFSNFTAILTKVSIPFFYLGDRYENYKDFNKAKGINLIFSTLNIGLGVVYFYL